MPHGSQVLAAVQETVTRCCPWVRVYIGPRLWATCDAEDLDSYACRPVWHRLADGRVEYEHGGLACWDAGVMLLASAARLPAVMDTVHHEVWHMVERHYLSPAAVSVVTAAIQTGAPRPGPYLGSAVERRARLYAAWASAVDEGLPTISDLRTGLPLGELEQVLHYVHSGRLAGDVARAASPARPGLLGRLLGRCPS